MKILAVFLLIFAVACTTTVTETESTPVQAAPLEVQTTSGEEFSLETNIQEGKPTVVYFMASWCPKCAQNWEALNEVYPKYEGDIEFIAVSIDPTDTQEVLADLAVEKGFVFKTTPGNPQLASEYGVAEQTTKFAIDAQGNIVNKHVGVLSAQEWDAFFESAQ